MTLKRVTIFLKKIKKCPQKALRSSFQKRKIEKCLQNALRSFFSNKAKLKKVPKKRYGPSRKG